MTTHWSWKLLRAGTFRLDGGGMFGLVPKTIWQNLAPPDEHNRIGLQTNCLLLENNHHKVVVETGYGEKWSDKQRDIYALQRRTIVDALEELNIDPPEITHVIVTHLHFDHAAGLTSPAKDGSAVPTFPNATVHVQQTEWDDALANKSTMTKTYLRSHLDPIADQVDPADGNTDVLPGIEVFTVPGHTWGQQAVKFDDGDGVVCFPGDVMPTINHAHRSFSLGYDMMAHENMLTKLDLLQQAAQHKWRLVLDHEPGDPVVRVQVDSNRQNRYTLHQADM